MTEREAIAQIATVVGGMLEALDLRLMYAGADTGAMRETLATIHSEMLRWSEPVPRIHYMKNIGPIGDAKP